MVEDTHTFQTLLSMTRYDKNYILNWEKQNRNTKELVFQPDITQTVLPHRGAVFEHNIPLSCFRFHNLSEPDNRDNNEQQH